MILLCGSKHDAIRQKNNVEKLWYRDHGNECPYGGRKSKIRDPEPTNR